MTAWMVFGGSLAAVLALAALAWWLKLGGADPALLSEDAAARATEQALPGFDAAGAIVAEDRLAALVLGRGDRVAVLKAHGAHNAAREVRWADIRATDEGLEVKTGERRFGAVHLTGVDVLQVRRLRAHAESRAS